MENRGEEGIEIAANEGAAVALMCVSGYASATRRTA